MDGASSLATPARTPARTPAEKARRLAMVERECEKHGPGAGNPTFHPAESLTTDGRDAAASYAESTHPSEASTLSGFSVGSTVRGPPESIEEDDDYAAPSGLAEPSPAAFKLRPSNLIPRTVVAPPSDVALGKRRRIEEDEEVW